MSLSPARNAAVIVLALLASCGARSRTSNNLSGDAPMASSTLAKLSLVSNAFKDGQPIPRQYTCDGRNEAPLLSWEGAPPETRAFALVVEDPDAPSGTFGHWGVFDIPASARFIGGGHKSGREAVNGFDKVGYGGPCPPRGHGVHHYHFRLFALDTNDLGLPAGAKVSDIAAAAKKHTIGAGELIGVYQRE